MRDMDQIDHPKVYKRERWRREAGKTRSCPRCKPHRGENKAREQRNWKKFRKTRYRTKVLL